MIFLPVIFCVPDDNGVVRWRTFAIKLLCPQVDVHLPLIHISHRSAANWGGFFSSAQLARTSDAVWVVMGVWWYSSSTLSSKVPLMVMVLRSPSVAGMYRQTTQLFLNLHLLILGAFMISPSDRLKSFHTPSPGLWHRNRFPTVAKALNARFF